MSNAKKFKQPRKPPVALRRKVRASLDCTECGAVAKAVYLPASTVVEAQVDHKADCEAVPLRHRERGELHFSTRPVVLFNGAGQPQGVGEWN